MSWVKLDDQFSDHPKLLKVGPLAGWLWISSLAYSSRYLTDGFIPEEAVPRLINLLGLCYDVARTLPEQKPSKAQSSVEVWSLVDLLLAHNLWEKADNGYVIHDFLDFNPSKKQVLEIRQVRAVVGQIGGKQKASNLLGRCQNNVVAKRKQKSTPSPTPSPTPKELKVHTSADIGRHMTTSADIGGHVTPKRSTKNPRLPIADDFAPSEAVKGWAAAQSISESDLQKHCDSFRDTCQANDYKYANWDSAFRRAIRDNWAKIVPEPPGEFDHLPRINNDDYWYCGCRKDTDGWCKFAYHGMTLHEYYAWDDAQRAQERREQVKG